MNILNQTKSIINSKLFNKYCQS